MDDPLPRPLAPGDEGVGQATLDVLAGGGLPRRLARGIGREDDADRIARLPLVAPADPADGPQDLLESPERPGPGEPESISGPGG